ncbi:MAG: 2Fe-2S iron-sulfur cluster-binding protein [Candidatus Thiodiazotropha lotti]|nr:2Fe-2S iron-sulfur cluster-binding protein [Candidatus Thiodiazotropha lotti]MCG8002766.1 2Fe-2S iron-sulfur cluster-binding protein [Candidatus Thiodiazotropha lotti]MCG8007112.1 2Fe-2S iron-sulfur cluster-binding protein [Candidatus Thiodiazotropha lotti]MCW4186386.1 2Fe-2S iron-sulfur cluster-binding protein [Candidatus Thiodiazotropha lotti]MCW4194693.1 2Fe-2S iron-sulfur cluster-binding protein [Candidatus Thiodiazotropha lotti]
MTTGTLALIILGAVVLQVAGAILVGLYRRRRDFHQISSEGGEVPPDSLVPNPASTANHDGPPAWEGYKAFVVRQRHIEDTNGSICSFYLVPEDGAPLPTFQPGQYLTFKLGVEDPQTHESRTVVRCYSLSDQPNPAYYRVSVKRVLPPAGQPELPPGLSSNFLHDEVREGSRLMVKKPSGHFYLADDKPLPVVLIAGGIGITPMLSILNTLMGKGSTREIYLFYGVRNGRELIMTEHLRSLAETHSNFHLHLCFSAPLNEEVENVDYHHKGRVDIPLLRATLKLMRHQFYVCGPAPMMESIVPGLEDWSVHKNDIYYESFGPATLVRKDETKLASATVSTEPISVTFSQSGKQVAWSKESNSLLEFAETQGIDIDSGCRAGSCGSCQTRLTAGEVEYSQQPDADVDDGYCLLCISKPKGNLTLVA